MTTEQKELNFFVAETEKFKISFHLNNIEQQNLHDLYTVKLSPNDRETFLFATLKYPLVNQVFPVFHSSFSEPDGRFMLQKGFYGFDGGFVHARNYLQDHFSHKDQLDLIIFDHGHDVPPFPGAKIKYFKSNGTSFVDATADFEYPRCFVFGGCSGDWDGDGVPELVFFDLADEVDPIMMAYKKNKLVQVEGRMPALIKKQNFRSLAGTKFLGRDNRLHLALGSIGNDHYAPKDLFIINDSKGVFRQENIRYLPKRRGGADWACVEMKNVRFDGDDTDHILAVYHDAKVQHGIIDLYVQKEDYLFEYFYKDRPIFEEKDSWYYRLELCKLNSETSTVDSIVSLKSRGLVNYVKKDLNFTLLERKKGEFVDMSHYLLPLKDKEFMGIAKTLNQSTGLHDLVFFDDHGNYYYCQTKGN